jgi:hypothetical protein
MLPLGGLRVKHEVQRGISVPAQHLLWDQGQPRKASNELLLLYSRMFTYLFYRFCYVDILWISTKLCKTPVKRMHVYMNTYGYIRILIYLFYLFIDICNTLSSGKFKSLLQFGKLGCYMILVAIPIIQDYMLQFNSFDLSAVSSSVSTPRFIIPERIAQKLSLPLLHVLSLPAKHCIHGAVP